MRTDQKERARVLSRALVGVLTNAEAAGLLRLSVRQVRRLKSVLVRKGPTGLVHGNRGRPSPRRLPDDIRARLVELATTSYAGFSHERICQLLAEREQLTVTRSTLRRILLEAGVQAPRRRPRLPPAAMPVTFNLGQRYVQFLDLQGADYREPVFQQAVDRWRRERPAALSFELELAE